MSHGTEPPELVFDDEAADIGADIPEQVELVQVVDIDVAAAGQPAGDQIVVDIGGAELFPLVVDVGRAVIAVAARLGHHVDERPRHWRLGAVAGGIDGHVVERLHVGVAEQSLRAELAAVDAFDFTAASIQAIRAVLLHRGGVPPADVDARVQHAWHLCHHGRVVTRADEHRGDLVGIQVSGDP